jgi:membrane protein DedA with SNARE-associated domain
MGIIHHILFHYGYFGIFGLLMFGIIGLPVPDETLLALCGYLATKGELHLFFVMLAAFLGSCSGITVSYAIGRSLGLSLVKKYGKYVHLTEERIERVHRWFEKFGRWLLVIGYFIPGVRHFSAMVAGSSKLSYPAFAPFAYTGALLWSSSFVLAGYFFGKEWENMSGKARHILLLVGGFLLILAAGWWAFHHFFAQKDAQQPPEDAAE